jgi:chromosomal replication initiation ATPase DnaA
MRVRKSDLLKMLAEQAGISLAEITGPRRFKEIVAARNKIMYELKNTHNCTHAQIARLVNKHHATVLHGIRRHLEQ